MQVDRVPTVYDVASVAGVSTATVSRYFRQPEKVAEATREKIRSVVVALGYVPSGSARGLAARRTGVFGLCTWGRHEPDEFALPPLEEGAPVSISRDVAEPRLYPLFADEVLRGAQLECTVRGFALMLGWGEDDPGHAMISEVAGRVDGLVVLPGVVPDEVLEHVARRIPVVVLADPPGAGSPLSHVTVDNVGGMRAMTDHLLDAHGLRDLWFVGLQERRSADGAERFQGFRSALRAAQLPVPDEPQLRGTGFRVDARAMAEEMLRGGNLPEAIVCGSDQVALGVIDVLVRNGVQVPGDVAVTGFDGLDAGRFLRPGLTTVRQPMDALGRVAVELLTDQVSQGRRAPAHRQLPVQVVLRESCGCLPA